MLDTTAGSFLHMKNARLDVCNNCEYASHAKTIKIRCGVCGCYMKAKVMIPTAKCPKDRWK